MESLKKTHVLKGTKSEIVQGLSRINGEVREAIVFVDESPPSAPGASALETEDIFAEMRPFMVELEVLDDSREAIYTRLDGE